MSLDDLIVYEAKGQGIPDIVKERGWSGFRDLEYEVCFIETPFDIIKTLFSIAVPN